MRAQKVARILGALGLSLAASSARAQCTAITAVPTTITTPGHYCLTKNLSYKTASGYAIVIQASDVLLDLGGYKLDNMKAARTTFASGIGFFERRNVTIRNGVIRGFWSGIEIGAMVPQNNEGALIENLEVDSNTQYGIYVSAHAGIVRQNRVISTGAGNPNLDAQPIGIATSNAGVVVVDNDVVSTVSTGAGVSKAISADGEALVVGNRIVDADTGIYFASTGKYRDNTTVGVTTPYVGGTAVGTTNQ